MKHTPSKKQDGSKLTTRQMIGLRMDPFEISACKEHAAADNRSAAAFALLMYRRGLAAWEAERKAANSSRRR